jgi:radical SAM protein with 4Fe4S-binding SPASM domain
MVHLRSLFQKAQMDDVESRCRKAFDAYGISSILWNVTYECGLKCKHCYVGETKKRENELNAQEAEQLVATIGDMGIPLLFMTGGEPLMRKDTLKLLRQCKEYGITTVLSSNGLLLDKEKIHELKQHNVHFVAVSVYGPPAQHDETVGIEGSYNKLMENVQECINQDINICLKTVVSNYTYEHIPFIVNKGIELGVKSFYLCDLLETGRAQGEHSWRVPIEKWQQLANYLFSKVIEEGEAEIDLGGCPSMATLALEHFKKTQNVDHATQRLEHLSACPIGRGPIGISAKGNILPCIFMQNFSIGNVLKDDLRTATTHPTMQAIASKNNLKGICGNCKYKLLCGGCRAKAYSVDGDIFGEDPTCMLPPAVTQAQGLQ